MRPQSLLPPLLRSKVMACVTTGTVAAPNLRPRPSARRKDSTPPAASRPNTEPPDSTTASRPLTVISGSSRALSRAPGAPPRLVPEATLSRASRIAVTPLATAAASAWPTATPGTSVMRFNRSRTGRFQLPPCPLPCLPLPWRRPLPLSMALARRRPQNAELPWRFACPRNSKEAALTAASKLAAGRCRSLLEIRDLALRVLLPHVHHVVEPRDVALLVVGEIADHGLESLAGLGGLGDLLGIERFGIGGRHRSDLHGCGAIEGIRLWIDVLGGVFLDHVGGRRVLARSGTEGHQRAFDTGTTDGGKLIGGDAVAAHQRCLYALVAHLAHDQATFG